MSGLDEDTTPEGNTPVIKAPASRPPSFSRTTTQIFVDQLQQMNHIGSFTILGPNNPRFIELNRNEIFNALRDLYTLHFMSKWDILKRVVKFHWNSTTAEEAKYLSQVYISHWFLDVYASNREACRKLPLVCTLDKFAVEIGIQSTIYDNYLTLLLNALKPTRVTGTPDSSILIPIICTTPFWNHLDGNNYFNIDGFILNTELFSALMQVMTDPNSKWLMNTYSNDVLGRPFWLLDWHNDQIFSWFPEDENYNQDDINLALILGVACTPHLAPSDDDIPQQYPNNVVPNADTIFKYERRIPAQFYSNYDQRVVGHQKLKITWEEMLTHNEIEAARQKNEEEYNIQLKAEYTKLVNSRPAAMDTAEGSGQAVVPFRATGEMIDQELMAHAKTKIKMIDPPLTKEDSFVANMYKIMDYKYYARVIRRIDTNTRTATHKLLIYND